MFLSCHLRATTNTVERGRSGARHLLSTNVLQGLCLLVLVFKQGHYEAQDGLELATLLSGIRPAPLYPTALFLPIGRGYSYTSQQNRHYRITDTKPSKDMSMYLETRQYNRKQWELRMAEDPELSDTQGKTHQARQPI